MQAVILAAGRGTRMRPLTDETPKPMLRILGKPLLEYILEAAEPFVDEFIIIVGYKAEAIKAYFGNQFKGIPIIYQEQKELLGTGHAIMSAENLIGDRFLMLNGDDYVTRGVIEKAIRYPLCIITKTVDNPSRFGIVESENGIVTGFEEKPPKPKSRMASTNIWVMNRKLVELMKKQPRSERGEYEITDALKELIKTEKVNCEAITVGWMPVGYPEDLEKLKAYIEGEKDGRA